MAEVVQINSIPGDALSSSPVIKEDEATASTHEEECTVDQSFASVNEEPTFSPEAVNANEEVDVVDAAISSNDEEETDAIANEEVDAAISSNIEEETDEIASEEVDTVAAISSNIEEETDAIANEEADIAISSNNEEETDDIANGIGNEEVAAVAAISSNNEEETDATANETVDAVAAISSNIEEETDAIANEEAVDGPLLSIEEAENRSDPSFEETDEALLPPVEDNQVEVVEEDPVEPEEVPIQEMLSQDLSESDGEAQEEFTIMDEKKNETVQEDEGQITLTPSPKEIHFGDLNTKPKTQTFSDDEGYKSIPRTKKKVMSSKASRVKSVPKTRNRKADMERKRHQSVPKSSSGSGSGVFDRLYGMSLPAQERGRRRREEIGKAKNNPSKFK